MRSDSIQRTAPPVSPNIGPGWGRPSAPTCGEKGQKGMAHYRCPPLEDSVPESRTTKHKQNKQERHPHHKGPASSPKRGRRERITKGSQTKPNKTQEKHNPLSQCHSLPRRAVGHWRSQCLLMSTQIPTKGLNKRRPEKTMTHPRLQGLLKSRTDGPGPRGRGLSDAWDGVATPMPRLHPEDKTTQRHTQTRDSRLKTSPLFATSTATTNHRVCSFGLLLVLQLEGLQDLITMCQVTKRFPGVMFMTITFPFNQVLGNSFMFRTKLGHSFVQDAFDLIFQFTVQLHWRRRTNESWTCAVFPKN